MGRAAVEIDGRKAVGAFGIETLRFSLSRFISFSFWGEGESSMMSTQPDESPVSLLFLVLF